MRNRISVLVLLMLVAFGHTPAKAEVGAPTPTVQAVAADATWLAYTPPPEHPGIVCMVDSGVDPNPDTEAAVIGGQALAPETEPNDEIARLEPRVQPGNHPNGHGTLMAMMMAAPINGWGMVGIAPTSVRVYNMKALARGKMTFPFSFYSAAINECQQKYETVYPAIKVINLSLGEVASPEEMELVDFANFVAAAHKSNLAVVAAAGNEGGAVLYPAAYPPVLAVGAGDAGSAVGSLCTFSSRGEGLDVLAPGCDSQSQGLEGSFEDDGSPAFGSGSSQASAIVSAVLASIRAYAPQLTYAQAEECLTSTTRSGSIDAAAAFDACGLAEVVSDGQVAEQRATSSQQGASSGSSNQKTVLDACTVTGSCQSSSVSSNEAVTTGDSELRSRCSRPQIVGVTGRNGHLVLQVRSRPDGCRLQARLRVRLGLGYSWRITKGLPATTLRLPKVNARGIEARFMAEVPSRVSSQWVAVHVTISGS